MVKSPPTLDNLSSRIQEAAEDRFVRLERTAADAAAADNRAVDPREAVQAALRGPLDFPPLAEATVPGDRVAIAVDESVPRVAPIVRGAIDALVEAGVAPDSISVVVRSARVRDLCKSEVGDLAEGVRFVVHDAEDPHDVCFVGLLSGQQTMRINRAIFDADVVLPIGCARLDAISGSRGVFDGLYPRFSDAETIARFRSPELIDSVEGGAAAHSETEEAGWLLGVPMVVAVVPGNDGSVAQVIAGEPESVAAHVQELCEERWSFHVPHRASLVVATVTGGLFEQTWDNVARALAAAERLVADDGAVAICSALERPPGKSLGRLVRNDDLDRVARKARSDQAPDSWPAWQLARALERGPVYFMSRLKVDTVEDLGLAPVADVEELVRLASRHESCIVVEDSQYALVTVNGEERGARSESNP